MKLILILFLVEILLLGCSNNKGTSTGNPLVNLRFGSFSGLSVLAVSEVKFCFKRLRFKQPGELTNTDSTIDEDNIDFEIGEKILATSGDNLGNVRVPPGNYERIEFDLDNSCLSGTSVSVTNTSGVFTTSQKITIKFTGNININSDVSVDLAMQNLINQLNTVTNSSEIKTKLEAVSAGF